MTQPSNASSPPHSRNVLLMGAPRSGKSMLVDCIDHYVLSGCQRVWMAGDWPDYSERVADEGVTTRRMTVARAAAPNNIIPVELNFIELPYEPPDMESIASDPYITTATADVNDGRGVASSTVCKWRQYAKDADVLVYVIDCCDQFMLPAASIGLEYLLASDTLPINSPVCVLFTKCDLSGGKDDMQQMSNAMFLDTVRDDERSRGRRIQSMSFSAVSGKGIDQFMRFIVK